MELARRIMFRVGAVTTLALFAFLTSVNAQAANPIDQILDHAVALKMETRYSDAEKLLLDGIDDAIASDNPAAEVRLAVMLGDIVNRRNLHHGITDDPKLSARLDHALQLAMASKNKSLIGAAHQILAQYYYSRELEDGQVFPNARHHAALALENYRITGDVFQQGVAVHQQGLIALQERQLQDARQLFEESLQLARMDRIDPKFEADYHRHVGFVDLLNENMASAIAHFRLSPPLRREAGFRDGEMFSLITLGSVLAGEGAFEEAASFLAAAAELASNIDTPIGHMRIDFYFGELYRATGEGCLAVEHYRSAVELAVQVGSPSVADRSTEALEGLVCEKDAVE